MSDTIYFINSAGNINVQKETFIIDAKERNNIDYACGDLIYSKNNVLSRSLAEKIRMPVISYLQSDNTREIKQSGTEIYLLHHAQAPAVMVECGFLSNKEETEKLKNEAYQQKLAFLIAIGIIDYFTDTEDV